MENKRIYKRLIINITLSLGILVCCLSCQQREAYYHFNELPNANWSKTDTLYFDIDSTAIELNVPYQISIEVSNNVSYSYRNLWLSIQDNIDDSNYSTQYILANSHGKWYGAGFGSIIQLSLAYKNKVIFTKKQNYRICIEQNMRDEPLVGIEKLGIRMIKTNDVN